MGCKISEVDRMFLKVACVILTLNESTRIKECLEYLRPHMDFILVLDGGSIDNTVNVAKKYVDKVIVHPFSGSFADEKNYARALVPIDCTWILWCDVDERFDIELLRHIKNHVQFAEENNSICWRFPRCNLPDGKDWPDYQVRLFKNSRDIEWRGKTHEVPYLKTEDSPLDQLDREGRKKVLFIVTADEFPIVHLSRRKDDLRPWW